MKETIVEIDHISYRYEREQVLEDIHLSIPKGAYLAIVGPNGSGKSTLIKLLLSLLKPQQGRILLFGEEIEKFKDWQKVGYVSQKANSFNSGFPATVYEVVASGLTKKLGLFRFLKKEDKQKIMEAVASVDMLPFLNRNIGELSGGQQQRIFIARALVSNPELLILDEPTVGVDAKNVKNFYDMLENLNKKWGITLLLVTHDISAISDKVTHVACLNKHLHFHGESKEYELFKNDEMSFVYGHDIHLLTHDHDHHHGGTNQ
ncbi:metal ABC transporter ATP-binding protein [Pseudoneobacillus rhizosphaerae]|uniref:Vitamin B12 import ATP-binding protein BtuD n=1 Tax=Pseudoneobacillus rhizosphaerae TaxID=2880968 RepID=A0A9C7G8Z3_9BACI|nr:metal ABC transporter ATP-binding protein [Pseudoneobacillus rhizosphaerae]CAG9608139.1 Vitamin B12 import ATP-binding protein BtuD [Pseudoneobacillus rhizosphaerae]